MSERDPLIPNGPLTADKKDGDGSDSGGNKETGRTKEVSGKKEEETKKDKKDG